MKNTFLFILLLLANISFASTDSTKIEPEIWLRTTQQSTNEKMLELTNNQAFLKEFNQKFGKYFEFEKQYTRLIDENVDNWEMELFDTRQAQMKFLKDYPKANELSDDFKQYLNNQIRWNYWHLLLAYPVIRSNANTKHLTLMSLPTSLLEGFEKIKVDDEKALNSEAYRNFITFYVTYFNSKDKNFIKYADMGKALEDKHLYAREHLSGKVYQYYLARLLDEYGLKSTPAAVRNVFAALSVTPEVESYTVILQPKLAELMAKKEEVKKKEDEEEKTMFKGKTFEGELITLKKFRGKVVYIDFWASWCGPCRAQFPFAKQLQAKLTDKQKKNIIFLYINIDDTEEVWKKTVETLKLEGFHLYSKGGWESEAAKFFNLSSIPRYMLIDKAGLIVQPNAKRPGDEFILNDLLNLLE